MGLSIDNFESKLSCNSAISDSLDVRCSKTNGEHSEDHTEEATEDISSSVYSFESVILDIVVDPHATHIKCISVSTKDACKENCHCKGSLAMGLDTSNSCSLEILLIVLDLFLFLPESDDHSDSIKSLISITCTLSVGLHSFLRALCENLSHERCSHSKEGKSDKEDQRETPTLSEGEGKTGDGHRVGKNDSTHLFT